MFGLRFRLISAPDISAGDISARTFHHGDFSAQGYFGTRTFWHGYFLAPWMFWHGDVTALEQGYGHVYIALQGAKMYMCRNVHVSKYPCAEMSLCHNVHVPKSPWCQKVPMMKCPCQNWGINLYL